MTTRGPGCARYDRGDCAGCRRSRSQSQLCPRHPATSPCRRLPGRRPVKPRSMPQWPHTPTFLSVIIYLCAHYEIMLQISISKTIHSSTVPGSKHPFSKIVATTLPSGLL